MAADNATNSGVIRMEVDKISTLDEHGRYFPEVKVGGMPWIPFVLKEEFNGVQCLATYVYSIDNNSTLWSVDVKAEYIVFNSDSSKNVYEVFSNTYRHDTNGWGCVFDTDECTWEHFMDASQGFIRNDTITVEIRFTVLNMKGIRTAAQFDFMDANDPRHDIALVIGGEKVYASKQFLSIHSPVFSAMFYGKFDEKNQKEIELKDVDREEFLELLKVIYPTDRRITDESAEFLLKLGDQFQIKTLLDLVENHLISSSDLDLSAKLLLSDQYRLIKLQHNCLEQLNSMDDMLEIKASSEYETFSDATKLSLLERIFRFSK